MAYALAINSYRLHRRRHKPQSHKYHSHGPTHIPHGFRRAAHVHNCAHTHARVRRVVYERAETNAGQHRSDFAFRSAVLVDHWSYYSCESNSKRLAPYVVDPNSESMVSIYMDA